MGGWVEVPPVLWTHQKGYRWKTNPANGCCQDQCSAGAIQCSGNTAYTCADSDSDGCLDWG